MLSAFRRVTGAEQKIVFMLRQMYVLLWLVVASSVFLILTSVEPQENYTSLIKVKTNADNSSVFSL